MKPASAPLIMCLFGLSACGAAEPTPEHHPHASDGASHRPTAHHHDSPESLRPLMRGLRSSMAELRGALAEGDIVAAETHAHAIAVACDDQDVHHVDAERFGPRFAEIDQELHSAAAEMAASAEAGDLSAARERYSTLLGACVSCHQQAPTASHVDLSALVAAEPR